MDEPPEIEKEPKRIIFLYEDDWRWLMKTYREFNTRLTRLERAFIHVFAEDEDDSDSMQESESNE